MKSKTNILKGLLGIATFTSGLFASAQTTDKWFGTVEFNPVFSTQSGADPSFNINLTGSRKLNDYLAIGVGAGINESFKFSGSPAVPVFARVTAEDFSKKFSPFVTFDIGYVVTSGKGLLVNPVAGIRYDGFTLGVGYHGFKSNQKGSQMASSVSIRLGYNFGYHHNPAVANFFKKFEFSLSAGAAFASDNYGYHESYDITDLGIEDIDTKHSVRPAGVFSAALTYPVWRNLYVGVAAIFSIYESGFNRTYGFEPDQDARPNAQEIYESFASRVNGLYNDDYSSTTNIVIAGRLKYKFRELTLAKKLFPYAQLDLGGCVDYYNGLYFAPEIGLSMAVGSRHSLDLGIGYTTLYTDDYKLPSEEVLGWTQPTGYFTDGRLPNFDGSKTLGAFKISLGYTF